MEITKLFFITYFAALAGVIPPGLINMSVAKACLKYGKRNGISLAAGASFIVLLQALIAVLLARYIFNDPFVRTMLLRSGVVIFIILGIFFLVQAQKNQAVEVNVPKRIKRTSFFKGMMIGVLNVLPIPYFCALGVALNVSGKVEYDVVAISFFVAAAAIGTFSALYIYATFFDRIQQRGPTFTKYSNYFMAVLMLVLVIITLIRSIYVV